MTPQEFLEAIRPGITLYAVLLTFALVAFQIAKHFWHYEKSLSEEMVERVRELMASFRETHVEPVIEQQLTDAVNAAYDLSLGNLLSDLYERKRTRDGHEDCLLPDDELHKLLDPDALEIRFNDLKSRDNSVAGFFSSKSGLDFLEKLDRAYQKQQEIARKYREVRRDCVRVAYAFLLIALICLVNLAQIAWAWPELASHFSAFAVVTALVFGLLHFASLEVKRRRILTLWEEKHFYGNV